MNQFPELRDFYDEHVEFYDELLPVLFISEVVYEIGQNESRAPLGLSRSFGLFSFLNDAYTLAIKNDDWDFVSYVDQSFLEKISGDDDYRWIVEYVMQSCPALASTLARSD